MTTSHPPTTEAIVCPVWCVKHLIGEDEGDHIIHDGAETYFGDVADPYERVGVMLEADPHETDAGGVSHPRVNVWGGLAELTLDDARRLAAPSAEPGGPGRAADQRCEGMSGERLADVTDQLRMYGVEVVFVSRLATAGLWARRAGHPHPLLGPPGRPTF